MSETKKEKEIRKTKVQIDTILKSIIDKIDEIDGLKRMLVTERKKLIKLTGWKMFNEKW